MQNSTVKLMIAKKALNTVYQVDSNSTPYINITWRYRGYFWMVQNYAEKLMIVIAKKSLNISVLGLCWFKFNVNLNNLNRSVMEVELILIKKIIKCSEAWRKVELFPFHGRWWYNGRPWFGFSVLWMCQCCLFCNCRCRRKKRE